MPVETLHWDGDALLFTSKSSGQVDDIKIETMGNILPLDSSWNSVTMLDRDFNGAYASYHNATGYDGWSINNDYGVGQAGTISPYGVGIMPSPREATISEPHLDGLVIYSDTIQGVRAYDPSSKSWTTPDLYPGAVHDPMSQKSYMWNRNNPVLYSDPSGYCIEGKNACMGGVDWNVNLRFGNFLTQIEMFLIPGTGEAGVGAKLAVLAGKVGDAALEKAVLSITDRKLGNLADNLFQITDRELGGTAGAMRIQLREGRLVGNKDHAIKATQTISGLEKWLHKNPDASLNNRNAAQLLLDDLRSAIRK